MKPKSKSLSIRTLAEAVGVSRSAVAEWRRRHDWPFGPSPWPATIIPRVRQWRARLSRSPARRDHEREIAALELSAERLASLREANRRFGRKFMPLAMHRRVLVSHIQVVRSRIEDWAGSIPSLCTSDPVVEAAMRKALVNAYDRFCADMHQTLLRDLVPAVDDDTPTAPMRNTAKVQAAYSRHAKGGAV